MIIFKLTTCHLFSVMKYSKLCYVGELSVKDRHTLFEKLNWEKKLVKFEEGHVRTYLTTVRLLACIDVHLCSSESTYIILTLIY